MFNPSRVRVSRRVQQLIRKPRPFPIAQKRSRAQPVVQRHVTKLSHQVHRAFRLQHLGERPAMRVLGRRRRQRLANLVHRPLVRPQVRERARPFQIYLHQRYAIVPRARARRRARRRRAFRVVDATDYRFQKPTRRADELIFVD